MSYINGIGLQGSLSTMALPIYGSEILGTDWAWENTDRNLYYTKDWGTRTGDTTISYVHIKYTTNGPISSRAEGRIQHNDASSSYATGRLYCILQSSTDEAAWSDVSSDYFSVTMPGNADSGWVEGTNTFTPSETIDESKIYRLKFYFDVTTNSASTYGITLSLRIFGIKLN